MGHISDRIKNLSAQARRGMTSSGASHSSEDTAVQKRNRHSSKRSPDRQMLKTRICNSFAKGGFCKYGADCNFAHAYQELQQAPDLRKTRLCKAFASGWCNDPGCNFAHGQEELRATDRYYKTSICVWHTRGKCTNGERCRFAHGHQELRTGGTATSNDVSTKASQNGASSEHGSTTPPVEDHIMMMQSEEPAQQPSEGEPAAANSIDQRRWQRQARPEAAAGSSNTASCTEVKRRVSDILKRISTEKFDTVYAQIMQCGICTMAHIETLGQVLFEEAALQRNFAGMFADLCWYLIMDFGESGPALRQAVLSRCWQLFTEAFQKQPDAGLSLEALGGGDDEEGHDDKQMAQKQIALGNVYFLAELTIRDVQRSSEVFPSIHALLERPIVPERLEALAALLSVIGPARDTPMWPEHRELMAVFWQISGLTYDAELPTRLRCMLQDLLALREAGWAKGAGQVPVRRDDAYGMHAAGAPPSVPGMELGAAGSYPAWAAQGAYAGGTVVLVPISQPLPPGAAVVAMGPQPQGCGPNEWLASEDQQQQQQPVPGSARHPKSPPGAGLPSQQ